MVKKLTLGIKVSACSHCNHANKAKLRQHRSNYCDIGFKASNGHCANFEKK